QIAHKLETAHNARNQRVTHKPDQSVEDLLPRLRLDEEQRQRTTSGSKRNSNPRDGAHERRNSATDSTNRTHQSATDEERRKPAQCPRNRLPVIRDELPQRLERTLVQLHRHITDTTKERLHAIRRRPLLKPSNDTLNCGASTIRQEVEQVRDLPEQRPDQRVNVLKQRRPEPAHGRAHLLERALSRVTSLKRRTADTLLHRLSENVERDLPVRPELLGLGGGDAHNVADHLPNRDTRRKELHSVIALQLPLSRDRTPDQAHIAQLAARN